MINDKTECCNKHQVVTDFYNKILGYVISKVNDREIAKDITQEVFSRFIDAYNTDLDITNLRAWLFQVSRNIIADRYRKKELLKFDESILENNDSADDGYAIEAEDFVVPMINLLPDEYRIPLFMSDIENVKQAEVAKKLGLSLSATKMRCQRGRQRLHELFIECCDIQYTESGAFAHCSIKSSCSELNKEK